MAEGVVLPGQDRFARATFAAILAAQKGSCSCETCAILRGVGEELIKEFGAIPEGRIRPVRVPRTTRP